MNALGQLFTTGELPEVRAVVEFDVPSLVNLAVTLVIVISAGILIYRITK